MRKAWPTSFVSKCLTAFLIWKKVITPSQKNQDSLLAWTATSFHSLIIENQPLKHSTIYFRSFHDLNDLRSRTLFPPRSVYNIFKVLKMVNYSDVVRKYSLQDVNHMRAPTPAPPPAVACSMLSARLQRNVRRPALWCSWEARPSRLWRWAWKDCEGI